MEKEYIEKILKLFKAGKIIINENGNLAFTADYVEAKNKKQITGPNKDKKKSYSSDTVKLSKKVYFSVLKSGEFRLRGGRKAALDLRESIKKEIEGKRIGENRRKIDSAILNMIDAYENKLAYASIKIKSYSDNQINEFNKTVEMASVPKPSITLEDKMKKINDEFESKQPKNKLTYKELMEPRKIQSELLSHEPHNQHAIENYYKKLYNMLDETQKNKVLLNYLKCKKRIHLLDKFLLKFNPKKYVERLCQDIPNMYEIKELLTYYIEYNLTTNSKHTIPSHQQKESNSHFKKCRNNLIKNLRKGVQSNISSKIVTKKSTSVQQKSQSPEDRVQFQ